VLVGANAALFVAALLLKSSRPDLFQQIYGEMLALTPAHPEPWQFVSYAFLHSIQDPWHIIGNMFFLWVFGPPLEDRLGRWKYLAFYLAAAAVSGAAHALFTSGPEYPLVGASGAIAGVGGAFLVLFPRTIVRVFLFFFLIGLFRIPAIWFLGFFVAWNLLITVSGSAGSIATLAHLGGYAFGAGAAALLLGVGLLPSESYDLIAVGKQRARRQQFKSAARIQQASEARVRADRPTPSKRPKLSPREEAQREAVAEARKELATLIREKRFDDAAKAYRKLIERELPNTSGALIGRDLHLELSNGLYRAGETDLAAIAYERYLGAYPNDADSPSVALMLGLIAARHLNDPVRARSLIKEAKPRLRRDHERQLADQLLAELG